MLEELDSIHPLLPPVAGILALLAGAFEPFREVRI
jgi:hypothetical protein